MGVPRRQRRRRTAGGLRGPAPVRRRPRRPPGVRRCRVARRRRGQRFAPHTSSSPTPPPPTTTTTTTPRNPPGRTAAVSPIAPALLPRLRLGRAGRGLGPALSGGAPPPAPSRVQPGAAPLATPGSEQAAGTAGPWRFRRRHESESAAGSPGPVAGGLSESSVKRPGCTRTAAPPGPGPGRPPSLGLCATARAAFTGKFRVRLGVRVPGRLLA